jgi:hypothetical protein
MLGLTALQLVDARASELNLWPLWVGQTQNTQETAPSRAPAALSSPASPAAATPTPTPEATPPASPLASSSTTWTSAGPFLFSQPVIPSVAPSRDDRATRLSGFRPFYVQKTDADGNITDAYVLPPLFQYQASPFGGRWKIFSLINRQSPADTHVSGPAASARSSFEVWPFYLSRQTGKPETSYRALFPVYGSITYRFGLDRWTWTLFPLYGKFEKNGVTTTTAPWPFVKVLRGDGNHGFELWPLFGHRQKAGEYRERFYLWPLVYKNEKNLAAPQPDVRLGVLPFYASTRDASSQSRTYLWPFFGWFDRTEPRRYHETRYFWPLFVRGEGEDRRVDRWAPFYARSTGRGVQKTWILWPLWRERVSDEGALIQTKRQVLYIVYNRTTQRSAANPAAAKAHKTHLWPLLTSWDNGAGRRQLQALSPLEVFFPHNETVRSVYSPLFAVYRYDRTSADHSRHALLWNLVTWRREPQTREFHLGPLLGVEKHAAGKRVALLAGIIGLDRTASRGWRPFLFKFKRRQSGSAPALVTPVVVPSATSAHASPPSSALLATRYSLPATSPSPAPAAAQP